MRKPTELSLASPQGPVLHLEPLERGRIAGHLPGRPVRPPRSRPAGLRRGSRAARGLRGAARRLRPAARGLWAAAPDGYAPTVRGAMVRRPVATACRPEATAGRSRPGRAGRARGPPHHEGVGDELVTAFEILIPVKTWLKDSGWHQGLRLLVIAYALLPLLFLALLSSSSSLSVPGFAYSLYVAPLWAIAFWLLRAARPDRRAGDLRRDRDRRLGDDLALCRDRQHQRSAGQRGAQR